MGRGPKEETRDNSSLITLHVLLRSCIHSSPLVRSTFCPLKFDHKSGLTLYLGSWVVIRISDLDKLKTDLISVDLTSGLECAKLLY